MKWPRIITVAAVVIMLFSGVSIAGYAHLYSPGFRIEFPEAISFFTSGILRLDEKSILETRPLVPISAKIGDIARFHNMVGKSV